MNKTCGTCENCVTKANGNCFCEVSKTRILNTNIDFNCKDYVNVNGEKDATETINTITAVMDELVDIYEKQSALMDDITRTFSVLSKYREKLETQKEEKKTVAETPRTMTLEELFTLLAQNGMIE